jgi:hypothetical protein
MAALERNRGDVEVTADELGMRRNTVTMVAKHARIRAGELPRPPKREQPRVVAPADIQLEDQEASAPATDAATVDLEPPRPSTVETPPPGPSLDTHSSASTTAIEAESVKPSGAQRDPLMHSVQIGGGPAAIATEEPAPSATIETTPPEPAARTKGIPCRSCSHAAVCSIRPKLEFELARTPPHGA